MATTDERTDAHQNFEASCTKALRATKDIVQTRGTPGRRGVALLRRAFWDSCSSQGRALGRRDIVGRVRREATGNKG